jgi:hypothetical protein
MHTRKLIDGLCTFLGGRIVTQCDMIKIEHANCQLVLLLHPRYQLINSICCTQSNEHQHNAKDPSFGSRRNPKRGFRSQLIKTPSRLLMSTLYISRASNIGSMH